MFSEYELLEAIDECQNSLPKTFTTAEKLAVFYTVLDHIQANSYPKKSADPAPHIEETVGDYGTTEFYLSVKGKEAKKIWAIFGELMDALKVLNPKLYDRTIERLTAVE